MTLPSNNPQLTSKKTCERKHTYYSAETATRAKKRRNKAAGIKYLSSYQCNVCSLWHVTTQKQEEQKNDPTT